MKTPQITGSTAVQVGDMWFPCEFQKNRFGIRLLSLGDIENDDVSATFSHDPLSELAQTFYKQLSDSRRIVVLTPSAGVEPAHWPCKQTLKGKLTQRPANSLDN